MQSYCNGDSTGFSVPSTLIDLAGALPVSSDLNGVHNFSNSSLTPGGSAGVFNYISSSIIPMPAVYKTGIQVGSALRWHIRMSKTAVGTGAFIVGIYMGTNGTIADTKEVSQTIGTATAALDDMDIDVLVTFTSTTAFYWSIAVMHSAATAVGFGCAIGSMAFSGTVTGLTTTTANLKFGVAYSNTTGTAVITVPLVHAEAFGIS